MYIARGYSIVNILYITQDFIINANKATKVIFNLSEGSKIPHTFKNLFILLVESPQKCDRLLYRCKVGRGF